MAPDRHSQKGESLSLKNAFHGFTFLIDDCGLAQIKSSVVQIIT